MIRLEDISEMVTVDLDVSGYAFPDSLEPEAADWLTVRVEVSGERDRFEGQGTALECAELERLAAWFGELAAGRNPRRVCLSFSGPALGFELLGRVDGKVRIGLALAADLQPDEGVARSVPRFPPDGHWRALFDFEPAKLHSIRDALERWRRAFPSRVASPLGDLHHPRR